MSSNYTKEFEEYFSKIKLDCGQLEYWQAMRIKRALFNAFKKGKQVNKRKRAYFVPVRSYI